MRQIYRRIFSVVGIIIWILFGCNASVDRADENYLINLKETTSYAVFTLSYTGVVSGMAITSPAGITYDQQNAGNAYKASEGKIQIGLSQAEAGRWKIQVSGEPDDGFSTYISNDVSYASFVAVGMSSTGITSAETDVVGDSLPDTTSDTMISSPNMMPTESIMETELMIEKSEVTGEPSDDIYESSEDSTGIGSAEVSESEPRESSIPIIAGVDTLMSSSSVTTSMEASKNILGESMQSDPLGQDTVMLSASPGPVDLSKGLIVYAGVFLPVILSIVVFFLDIKTQRQTLSTARRSGKNLSLLRKKHHSSEGGLYDDVLWQTSTWQEPYQQK